MKWPLPKTGEIGGEAADEEGLATGLTVGTVYIHYNEPEILRGISAMGGNIIQAQVAPALQKQSKIDMPGKM